MNTDWLKDCKSEEDKKARKDMIRTAAPTLKVLRRIIERKLEEESADHLKKVKYDSPSWAYIQADSIGCMRTLNYVLSLLDQEEIK